MWSNLDLVMMVRKTDLPSAIKWIASRFPVPTIAKGAHINKRSSWSPTFSASYADSVIEQLVRSGVWSDLSHAEQSLLPVMNTFADPNTGWISISYQGLQQYAGVGSSATIRKALQHFCSMGLLQVEPSASQGVFRSVGRYRFTVDDARFQALTTATYQSLRTDVAMQREMRKAAQDASRRRASPV